MAMQFPASPAVGQTFSPAAGVTYRWSGLAWYLITPGAISGDLLGQPGGVATLDGAGQVPASQLGNVPTPPSFKTTVFTGGQSGNFTPDAGCTSFTVECWGAGGSGGGGNGATGRGVGGGGGGYAKKTFAAPLAPNYPYAVGVGGAVAAQGVVGNPGGSTTFNATVVAGGGAGGTAGTGSALAGVVGGGVSGGDELIAGGGSSTLNGGAFAAPAGDSPKGGLGGKTNIAEAGGEPGGGGMAANFTGSSGRGGNGRIVITELVTA